MWTDSGLKRRDIETSGRKLVRLAGKQILVIAQDGQLFAIAGRCPHEGYPLSEGTLGPGCVLTCNWHNWKFDLASGEALVGGDPVRTYPLEDRAGRLFIDLTEPPAQAQRERALAGLAQAIADIDSTRMAREVARLERAGFDGTDALRHTIEISAERFEFGMGHAYAAAADWLKLSQRANAPEKRLAALIEPIYNTAWDIAAEGHHPFTEGAKAWNDAAFTAAVCREDEAPAQRILAGALSTHVPYRDLRPAFSRAALASYADFGHSAIYTFKAGELIDALGAASAAPILKALTRSLAFATREERLPEFRGLTKALAEWGAGEKPARAEDMLHQSIDGALHAVLASSARPPREIYDALMGAAAWNQLHFDIRWQGASDNALADNISWLGFTHALTFANAARHLCEETPELWPNALLQLALFVGRNKKYVDARIDVSPWRVEEAGPFLSREMDKLYDHGQSEPIVSAHLVKVLFALDDELQAAPAAPWGAMWLAATNRFLNSPLKRRHALRTATQALDFIAQEG